MVERIDLSVGFFSSQGIIQMDVVTGKVGLVEKMEQPTTQQHLSGMLSGGTNFMACHCGSYIIFLCECGRRDFIGEKNKMYFLEGKRWLVIQKEG